LVIEQLKNQESIPRISFALSAYSAANAFGVAVGFVFDFPNY